MKVLVVGAIHGRWELVNQAFDKFLTGKYDKIIFTGDICDSWDRSNMDMIRCYNIIHAMTKMLGDKLVLLIGNHDEQYIRYNPEAFRCTGFRPDLHRELNCVLAPYKKHYQYAYGIKNFLFTHAGVQYAWFSKHFHTLNKWAETISLDIEDPTNLWILIDGVARTHDEDIIHEIGPKRGGFASEVGGPLWCDMEEMILKGPYPGLNQVCGHTKTDHIYRFHKFEGNKHYKDTSVTYVDVLNTKIHFLTLYID